MLALEDAEHYMGIINSRIAEEKLNIENKDKFDFYVIRSLCNVLEDDNNSAMLNCEKMLPLYNGETDLYESYTYNYICGLAQMNMTQSDLAYKYADRCIAISKKLGDENLEFNAEMIREAAQFSGWRDVFTVDFSKVRVNEEILRKLKNIIILILTHIIQFLDMIMMMNQSDILLIVRNQRHLRMELL